MIPKQPAPEFGRVTYEIHFHPTYRAPCLWFSLHGLSVDEPAFNLDTVFRRLVPNQFKDGLRAVGGIGGISADVSSCCRKELILSSRRRDRVFTVARLTLPAQHHPVTGIPCFFVHPCLLGDAMRGFDCSMETYLMVWLGLVGGTVGLWVPKEMALD